jgi:hypothetical protein
VRDVVSHLLGFQLLLQGDRVPEFEGPFPEHVHNAIGEINEAFVQSRRNTPGREVLDEFHEVARDALARLRALSEEEWDKVGWSPEGDRPHHRFQETRVNRFESSLPYVLAKKMGSPDGTTLQVNLSGRQARTILLEVTSGRAGAVASLSTPATLEISTPVALFWRRSAGRISAEAFLRASSTNVRGDRSLAESFAANLNIMI